MNNSMRTRMKAATMKSTCLAVTVVALASVLAGCGAAPPKILISQAFQGDDKNLRTLMQFSGKKNEATKAALFNVWVSVCDVTEANAEAACKESKVLDDVVPGSLY